MNARSLPKSNVLRRVYEHPRNIIVCFDLLMTRQRISRCQTAGDLKILADQIQSLAKKSLREIATLAKTQSYGRGLIGEIKRPIDFSPCIRTHLIQDTIIVIYDIHYAIREDTFAVDYELGTFLLFVCHSAQNTLDLLLAEGIMARGAIGCGTLLDSGNLILGTAFLDAYDHIEGPARKPILGVEVSPQFMKYQNWIYDYLNDIKCSVGDWMDGYVYLEHGNCVYIDPCIRDRQIYDDRLALLRNLGCNDRFLFPTADLYISSLRRWNDKAEANTRGWSDEFEHAVWQNAKYREPRPDLNNLKSRFDEWRRNNTKLRIGLMRMNAGDQQELPARGKKSRDK